MIYANIQKFRAGVAFSAPEKLQKKKSEIVVIFASFSNAGNISRNIFEATRSPTPFVPQQNPVLWELG